jgi:Cys-tRNA(Pro) deacylase
MGEELTHTATQRVVAELRQRGLTVEVRHFPAGTRTAADAAAAIGTHLNRIVKSLVLLADHQPVLALVCGVHRVDPAKLARHVGATAATMASAEQVRQMTGFVVGGVPPVLPIDVRQRFRAVMDPDLLEHDVVWAAAGTPDTVFAIAPETLRRLVDAEVVDLTAS